MADTSGGGGRGIDDNLDRTALGRRLIGRLAIALTVSADELIFGKDERGPDEDLRLQFEAISQFDDEDKELARGLLEGLILKHQAKQSVMRQAARSAPAPAKAAGKSKRRTATSAHR